MNKSIKSLLIALTLTLTTSSVVSANPVNNSQSQINNIEVKIEKLDNQIENVMRTLDDNKKQIASTENQVKSTEKELKDSEENIKKQQELFNSRMRAMYINGPNGYLGMILSSEGLGDLVSKVDMIKRIVSFDKNIIEDYTEEQGNIKKKKDNLVEKNKELIALKADNEKKLSTLNADKEKQKALIVQAKEQQRLYAAAEQAAVNNAVRQVESIRKEAPKVSLSRGTSSVSSTATTSSNSSSAAPASSNNVIAYASNFTGTPYVWGGSTPSGFDCSGFTSYVYRHFGVSIGRTTYDQINAGSSVSRDQLQSGDLVFFGSSGNPTHVGIYVGNGAYIHSPRTGDVVKVSPLNRGDYIGARRVN